jgi:hypothetical protein
MLQLIVYPPSTTNAWPWTKDACVEQRNRTVLATSSGVPILFIGAIFIAGLSLSVTSSELVVMGVAITPGHTQLTLIPSRE